ncbi:hypothetical protein DMH08_25500 [Actinomadura sp. WAC 06369]|nr:hypothetical protein DMH08_25500 [Actinomadura sp. WAC 06369]
MISEVDLLRPADGAPAGETAGWAAPVARLAQIPGHCLTVRFRGEPVTVVAELDEAGVARRQEPPVTDAAHLELLTGIGAAPRWPRPVRLNAVITHRKDPVRAVRRASRWASYASRIAVAPAARVDDRALVGAHARGVWVVGYEEDRPSPFRLAAHGEDGPSAGSERGLGHRLLDELIWDALQNLGHDQPM